MAQQVAGNPRLRIRPDYRLERFAPLRTRILGADADVAEAVELLNNLWLEEQTADIAAWDEQVLAPGPAPIPLPAPVPVPVPGPPHDPAEPRPGVRPLPAIQANVGPSSRADIRCAPAVFDKLRQVQYVPLYHFTLDACRNHTTTDSDADLSFRQTPNGLVVTSLSATSRKTINDADLSWDQVGRARIIFLREIERAGWPVEYRSVYAELFLALDSHPMADEPHGKAILIQYFADVRREFHDAIAQGRPLFDLGLVNDTRLNEIAGRFHRERQALVVARYA
ncbi:hypothetical protein BC834DRAFT_890851 [Gloeopeniophorella convolvens]|nr:hypothetical protein BC834DRAFT_890851 [Gloeopeniophorella convolvens]